MCHVSGPISPTRRERWALTPFSTAVPFWGPTTQNLTGLSPKRDCGSIRVKGLGAACWNQPVGRYASRRLNEIDAVAFACLLSRWRALKRRGRPSCTVPWTRAPSWRWVSCKGAHLVYSPSMPPLHDFSFFFKADGSVPDLV